MKLLLIIFPVYCWGQRSFSPGAESLKLFEAYKPTIEQRNHAIVDDPKVIVGDINGDHQDDCLIYFVMTSKEGGNAIIGSGTAIYLNTGTGMKVVGAFPEFHFCYGVDSIKDEVIYGTEYACMPPYNKTIRSRKFVYREGRIRLLGTTGRRQVDLSQAREPVLVYTSSTSQLKSNKIPDSVFRMFHIRDLAIAGMDCDYGPAPGCWMISEIPAAIGNLKELESLQLTLGTFKKIPDELAELHRLRVIDFTDCSLSGVNLGVLTKIRSLEKLYLYGCGLTKLPAGIAMWTNLKDLGLAGNQIDSGERERIRKALPHCRIIF